MVEIGRVLGALSAINASYGTAWRDPSFLGGRAQGAWQVADANGDAAVLKVDDHPVWARQVGRLASTLDYLRARGYPASRVLLEGPLPDGGHFYIQELLPGRSMSLLNGGRLTDRDLDLLLEVLQRHEDLAAPTPQDWSKYVSDVLFGRLHEWEAVASTPNASARRFLDNLADRVERYEGVALSHADFVTGSFTADNTLIDGGKVTGAVDLDASGRGDRMIDLAIVLTDVDDGALAERIRAEASAVGKRPQLELAAMYWALASVNSAVRRGDPKSVERVVGAKLARLSPASA